MWGVNFLYEAAERRHQGAAEDLRMGEIFGFIQWVLQKKTTDKTAFLYDLYSAHSEQIWGAYLAFA